MTTTDPTTHSTDPTADPARDRALSAAAQVVRGAVFRVVSAADPDAFTVEPVFSGSSLTERQPVPVPALRAAALLSRMFITQARRQVRRAREAGVSWADLAPALDMEDGQAAFEWATGGGIADQWRRSAVTWRCPACGGLVGDYGPYESHPADNESGHTTDCTRLAAAVAAWEAEQAADDDAAESERCASCRDGESGSTR